MTTSHQLPPPDLLVVDLDGTLVLGNSFHEFLSVAWRLGGVRLRAGLFFAFARRAVSSRPDRRWKMKQSVLRAFTRLDPMRQRAITEGVLVRLQQMLSQPVLREIDRARDADVPVILATAAPALYARPFAEALQLSECLATDSPALELIGDDKARAVLEWMAASGTPAEADLTVVTDHRDDLPLMQIASHVVLQGTPTEIRAIEGAIADTTIAVSHIDAVSEQTQGGHWLWFDDRASGPYDVWELRTILSKHRYALGYVGAGRWTRVQPGRPLEHLVARRESPRPPAMRQRIKIMARRQIVRDRLRIFH